jgi:PST family polysaccharide transporter
VNVVLGTEWRPAAPVLAWLCAAGFGFAMCLVAGAILMGLGRSQLQLRMAAILGLISIGAVALAAWRGLEAVAVVQGVGVLLATAGYLLVLARDLEIPPRRLASALAQPVAGSSLMAAILLAAGPRLASLPDVAELGLAVILGGSVYAATLAVIGGRRLIADAKAFSAAHAAG